MYDNGFGASDAEPQSDYTNDSLKLWNNYCTLITTHRVKINVLK